MAKSFSPPVIGIGRISDGDGERENATLPSVMSSTSPLSPKHWANFHEFSPSDAMVNSVDVGGDRGLLMKLAVA